MFLSFHEERAAAKEFSGMGRRTWPPRPDWNEMVLLPGYSHLFWEADDPLPPGVPLRE